MQSSPVKRTKANNRAKENDIKSVRSWEIQCIECIVNQTMIQCIEFSTLCSNGSFPNSCVTFEMNKDIQLHGVSHQM